MNDLLEMTTVESNSTSTVKVRCDVQSYRLFEVSDFKAKYRIRVRG